MTRFVWDSEAPDLLATRHEIGCIYCTFLHDMRTALDFSVVTRKKHCVLYMQVSSLN